MLLCRHLLFFLEGGGVAVKKLNDLQSCAHTSHEGKGLVVTESFLGSAVPADSVVNEPIN